MVNPSVIRRKIDRIEEHLRRIKAIPLMPLENFLKDTISQDVLLFNLIQAIQNCIDIATHVVSDEGWGMPGTQSETFEILGSKAVISKELVQKLIAMTGFRNRIIHEYEKLNINLVYAVWEEGTEDIEKFCLFIIDRFKL